ncbi:MAG: type 4a pilus biogenesis protein PilO [Steroidobacteraceae bacterium]|nr:type 4a pilus biogenesis protein PilO [Steroidobacteraceae bacterium]MCC7198372.1 type 4a pilus biogenesis protein PilO [Gammaproteobacteria bacterium]
MNFLGQLKALDPKDVGRWPLLFRALAIGLIMVVSSGLLIWYFVINGNVPTLKAAEAKQQELWRTFDEKQRKAANLGAYKQQLEEIERTFGAMLRQLPGKTEVPNLLVDISQTGLGAGLKERLFQPGSESRRDFYAELPIKIRLTGSYHEFGEFVSGIAALPRIVTLHDIAISRDKAAKGTADTGLVLDLTAKTYRYLDEAELAAEQQAKSSKGKKDRKGARKP